MKDRLKKIENAGELATKIVKVITVGALLRTSILAGATKLVFILRNKFAPTAVVHQFDSKKSLIQDELLSLAKRCGKNCNSMMISLKHEKDSHTHDGKPWGIFGYSKELDKYLEISSLENAGLAYKQRFPIEEESYHSLIDGKKDLAYVFTEEELKREYLEIYEFLIATVGEFKQFVAYIQRDKHGSPLYLVAITEKKDTAGACDFYGKEDCRALVEAVAKDVYKYQ